MKTGGTLQRRSHGFLFAPILLLVALFDTAAAPAWSASTAGVRTLTVAPAPNGAPGFTQLTASQTGIHFTNVLPQARYRTNQVLLNGSGVAAGDIDGDGWCDIYFCGLDRPNGLYRNLGNWKFQDITAQAGVRCEGLTSTGAALVDFDGDGDLDLIVNSVGHGTRLFLNDGTGHFVLAGVFNPNKGGMSMAVGDLNGDGYLDLYVANYRTQALMDMPNMRFNFATTNGVRFVSRVNGRPATDPDLFNRYRVNSKGGIEENGETDEVYFNLKGEALQPVPFTGGAFLDEEGRPLTEPPLDWGLSVMIRDLNQDGRPDIWVCNDFDTADRIWLNEGGGRFRAAPRLAFRKSSHFAMGIDVADINRDGWDDIFVVDMLSKDQVMRMDMMGDRTPPIPEPGVIDNRPDYMINTLFLNRGDGTYAEIAQLAGVAATEWSWTPAFLDVDLDGYEDLLVANGHERAARSLDVSERLRVMRSGRQLTADEIFDNRRIFPRQNSPNLAFRNRRDLTFEDVSRRWGFDFDGVSHGMALADLDNDGDLDVLVNNLNGLAGVYRNNSPAPRLAVRLKGNAPNTRGVGARIVVRGPGLPQQSQVIVAGGRYLSNDDSIRAFAAGQVTNRLEVAVQWPNGKVSVVPDVAANRIIEINESTAILTNRPAPMPPKPWFEDVSDRLKHGHHEEIFDDFALQPLLPRRLSQLGPGVAWADMDGDGREDLIVGSGKGGPLAVLRNNGATFSRLTGGALDELASRDQTAIVPWSTPAGERSLLVGFANYEDGQTNGAMVRAYDPSRKIAIDLLPPTVASAGALALADLDGDGHLDLFVGGRVQSGRYPAPVSSTLWKGGSGGRGFVRDEVNHGVLRDIGMITGAVFTDVDDDGDPDLILAAEWGPLKILRNEKGKLVEWNPRLSIVGISTNVTLRDLHGLWNGVTTADFDGDGRMDIVAGNWGRNSRYETFRAGSGAVELIYGDFDGADSLEMVEAHYDGRLQKMVPDRQLDFLARAMPYLRERFASNVEYGRASVDDVLRDHAAGARKLRANWVESTVFLNRGDSFEARPLPSEAQFAPVFGVCSADFNGDGAIDVFLSQNFFAGYPETPRHDGGVGLVLAGDGHGNFRALSTAESGVRVFGEQRGAAVADFDGDGAVDFAVTQNGAATKLYRNAGVGRPGVRVRLEGPPENPLAYGAKIRGQRGDVMGPAIELHGGSGYWSHDSLTIVLTSGSAEALTAISVRWPDGKLTTSALPAGARSVKVNQAGVVAAVP